jgi:hypothetical protein
MEFLRTHFNNLNLVDDEAQKFWFLGILPNQTTPSFAVLSAVMVFQYCIWEEKLRKRKPAFRTINVLFEDIFLKSFAKNKILRNQPPRSITPSLEPLGAFMGPHTRNNSPALTRSRNFFHAFTRICLKMKHIIKTSLILLTLQHCIAMETGTGSILTAEEAARLGTEDAASAAADAAAAAATALKKKILADKKSGIFSPPRF